MPSVASDEHLWAAGAVRRALALLERIDDARSLGIEPAEPHARDAVAAEPLLEAFLRQDRRPCDPATTLVRLREIASTLEPAREAQSDGDRS
jgi:flagellar biosynthesis/type III secretory pathway ATPase